jgi:hypothetical protein
MLKYAFLAGVMTLSAPALAQTQTNTAATQATPGQTVPDSGSVEAQPQSTAPADVTTSTDTAQTAATQPAGGDQVATVVQTEFPTYDANKDGKLEKAEFASWMVKLKQASDPKASAESASTKKWVNAAFAQADTDKSRSVSQPELIGFLSKGQS